MKRSLNVKKGDTVLVLSGNDKGEKAKVLEVSIHENKVILEGKHLVKKHVKPKKMGDPGGIITAEGAIYADKVMVVCPNCSKPTRVGHQVAKDGSKSRLCKKCKETF